MPLTSQDTCGRSPCETVVKEQMRWKRGISAAAALCACTLSANADLTFEKPASVLRTEMLGKQIHEKGVTPDYEVEYDIEAVDAEGKPVDTQLEKAISVLESMM